MTVANFPYLVTRLALCEKYLRAHNVEIEVKYSPPKDASDKLVTA